MRCAEIGDRASYVGRIGALAVALGIGLAVPASPGIAWADPLEQGPLSKEPDTSVNTPDDGVSNPSSVAPEPVTPPTPPANEPKSSVPTVDTSPNGGTAEHSITANTVEVAPGVIISSSGGAQTSSAVTGAQPAATSAEPPPPAAAVTREAPATDTPAPVAPVAPAAPTRPRAQVDHGDRGDHGGHGYEWIDPGRGPPPLAVINGANPQITHISMTTVPDSAPIHEDTASTSAEATRAQWDRTLPSKVTDVDVPAPAPPLPERTRVALIVGALSLFGFAPGGPMVPGGGAAPVLQLAWAAWRRESARPENTLSTPTPEQPVTNGNCEPLICAVGGPVHGDVTFVDGTWNYTPTERALHAAAATDATASTTTDAFTMSIGEENGSTTEIPVQVSLLAPISAETAEVQRIPVGNGPNFVIAGPDGRYVYIPHAMDSAIGVLDSWTGSVTYLDTAAPLGRARLTADGSLLYAANGSNGTMTVVNTAANAVIGTVPVDGYASDFVLDANSGRACVLINPPEDGFELVVIDSATVIGRAQLGPDADLPTITPDGSTLFVRDTLAKSIRAVDTTTFSIVDIPAEQDVTHLAVSPDGRHLFASTIPDLNVYDTHTNALVRSFPDLGGALFLVFSPDGSILYTASLDGDTLAVIDTATLTHTTVTVGPNPTNAAVSPDGQQLFLLNGDGTVSVLDTVTKSADTIDIHGKPNDQYQIALSPDGRHVYVPQYETGTLAVISARTANLAPTVDVDQADDPGSGGVTYTAAGADADGDELLYTAAPLAPGTLTNLGGGEFRFVPDTALSGHLPPGIHDAVSITVSDGHGGSASVRGTYVVAPSDEATVIATLAVGGEVRSVAVSPDGTTAYVPIIDPAGRSRVEVLDTTSGDLLAIVALADDPRGTTSLSANGSRLVVPGGEYVMIIDTTTFEVIAALEGADHAVLAPDGLKAYALRAGEMSVHDVDPGSESFGSRIRAVPTGGYAEGMVSGADGRIYFATSDFTVAAIDTATDEVVATIRMASGSHNLTAAPGRVYAALHGTSLAVIDTDTDTVRANVPIRVESPGPYVTANADGSRIYLSRREEGILSVFDPSTNTIIASARVGDGTVAPAAVSADGSLVVVPVGDSVTIVSTGRNVEV